jgi:hypothetical protein
MRYIDTGAREADQALGAWLDQNVLRDPSVSQLRWQTGFFGSAPLAYFAPLLGRLRESDGIVRVLVGSNDGTTSRADVATLLGLAGPERGNQTIGVVNFRNAYFHPKTIHLSRHDGSMAAYVGSANITGSGVTSLHIEAGLLLDTRDGDDPLVVERIGAVIDAWFERESAGLHVVKSEEDLDRLVLMKVLDVPRPPRPPRREGLPSGDTEAAPMLTPLLLIPAIPVTLPGQPGAEAGGLDPESAEPGEFASATSDGSFATVVWTKSLTPSDAQRKRSGNQRGSITLVQAGDTINAQTFFRYDFFASANWQTERTRTGQLREVATVGFRVNLPGKDLGIMNLMVTYAKNRESSQANYTSLLHIGPLATEFAANNLTGRTLRLERMTNGGYSLTIS